MTSQLAHKTAFRSRTRFVLSQIGAPMFFAPRIGFTESTCKSDYAVDLPKQERWNQFMPRRVAGKSSVEMKPTRKNLAHGSGIDGDGGERPTCLSKKSNSRFQQTLSLQVKLSKDFLCTMKPIFQEQERWFSPFLTYTLQQQGMAHAHASTDTSHGFAGPMLLS